MIERADKIKNQDKVAASIAKNPLQSTREIAKDSGVSKSTAAVAKANLGKLGHKDDRIVHLTNRDFELMQDIQDRKFERMSDKTTPVSDNDVNNWDKEAKARYTLFRGDATDQEGGLKDNKAVDSLNNLLGLE